MRLRVAERKMFVSSTARSRLVATPLIFHSYTLLYRLLANTFYRCQKVSPDLHAGKLSQSGSPAARSCANLSNSHGRFGNFYLFNVGFHRFLHERVQTGTAFVGKFLYSLTQ